MPADNSSAETHSAGELRSLFDSLAPWFHNLVVDGVPTKTAPAWGEPMDPTSYLWGHLSKAVDFTGKRVLDVGCNGGFYLVETLRAGATSCLGVEGDDRCARQASLMADLLGQGCIEVRNASAYDIDESWGEFEVTLLLGLIYHLKDPVRVIDQMSRITTEVLVIETALRNSDADLRDRDNRRRSRPEMEYVGKPNVRTSDRAKIDAMYRKGVVYEGAPNWWMPNIACVEALLHSAGFTQTEVAFHNVNPSEHSRGFGRGMVIGRRPS